jgi:hypothetical protein
MPVLFINYTFGFCTASKILRPPDLDVAIRESDGTSLVPFFRYVSSSSERPFLQFTPIPVFAGVSVDVLVKVSGSEKMLSGLPSQPGIL